ncbi:hypothetical protein ACFVSU_07670 [Microbacterium sp. NPDC058062]|uniref:hypothetical protein n=1 Tax=Microbacterium sp. NPDC058062 TaxID=3346320 RepID=UPI0036DA542F
MMTPTPRRYRQIVAPPRERNQNLAALDALYELIQVRRINVDDWNYALAASDMPEGIAAAEGFSHLGWNVHALDLLHARICVSGRITRRDWDECIVEGRLIHEANQR